MEITLAIGVIAFCLLGLFSLLPIGLRANRAAIEQTAAGLLATEIQADLRATRSGQSQSARYGLRISDTGDSVAEQVLYVDEDGNGVVGESPSQDVRYRVCVGIDPPKFPDRFATHVRMIISWPPLADSKAGWPMHHEGAFESVFSLRRN